MLLLNKLFISPFFVNERNNNLWNFSLKRTVTCSKAFEFELLPEVSIHFLVLNSW